MSTPIRKPSLGGIDFCVGHFFSDTRSLSPRQSANYSNCNTGGGEFDDASFLALDYHFGSNRLQPFVGVNAGRAYGDNTNETWIAGLEAGLKFSTMALLLQNGRAPAEIMNLSRAKGAGGHVG